MDYRAWIKYDLEVWDQISGTPYRCSFCRFSLHCKLNSTNFVLHECLHFPRSLVSINYIVFLMIWLVPAHILFLNSRPILLSSLKLLRSRTEELCLSVTEFISLYRWVQFFGEVSPTAYYLHRQINYVL